MAEIAGGAVRSLLGVISNEMNRLGHVGQDVQFIKEEMESMNSFLMHLARTTPPGREHDEQVRTWMKQVRELAHDCSNSIDRYLRNGNRTIYRARSSLGYLWWVPWYLQKLFAQHVAASELRELKARARDVGERRQRYGVMIPSAKGKQAEAGETETQASTETIISGASQVTEEDGDSVNDVYNPKRRALAFDKSDVLQKSTKELVCWLKWLIESRDEVDKDIFPAIVIVARDETDGAQVVSDATTGTSIVGKSYCKMSISVTGNSPEPRKILQDILNSLPPTGEVFAEGPEIESDNTNGTKAIDAIKEIEGRIEEHLQPSSGWSRAAPLDVLLDVLRELLIEHGLLMKHRSNKSEETVLNINSDKLCSEKLGEAARMIELYLQAKGSCVDLNHPEYISILQQLLPKSMEVKVVGESNKDKYHVTTRVAEGQTNKQQEGKRENKLSEDQIEEKVKETTEKVIAKMLLQLLPMPHEESDQWDQGLSHKDIKEKIKGTLKNVGDQLWIEETAKKISKHLRGERILIVLEAATVHCLGNWENINCALSKMGCAAGSAVVITTKQSQDHVIEKFCNTKLGRPIKYSLVGYYRDKAVELMTKFVNEDKISIFDDILKKCEPHEFCMKMFVCALYANPKRNIEELGKLNNALLNGGQDVETKANNMIKFFYNELHRDYKTCLLYLAIFPPDDDKAIPQQDGKIIISRSTLVARWVVEGLIAGEDWSKSVRRANKCFDELANRWLVCPVNIGATGKVKSCKVHELVHSFITKMAREEHITDGRLSHHLARHFSVRSNIRLRPSERMEVFLKNPSHASFQLQLLKVLDLEGSESLKQKNQKHLKVVCNTIILLKFLSLRNTSISQLPKEINKLQQLEVLDIRQTCLGTYAIKNLMLMKLKHLLVGGVHPDGNRSTQTDEPFSTIQMPRKTGRMAVLEVLSHVQAPREHDKVLRDIGQLWQLRKLGVVIYDSEDQIINLLQGIGDLSECLESLSIQMMPDRSSGVSAKLSVDAMSKHFQSPPRFLKSLKISGIAMDAAHLLTLLAKRCKALAKVTLHHTLLPEDGIELLSKLDKLFSLKLRDVKSSQLKFKPGKLPHVQAPLPTFKALRYLTVQGGNINSVNFEDGTAACLEKIGWSFGSTKIETLSGIKWLGNLQDVEFNGDVIPNEVVEKAMKECPKANFKQNIQMN